MERTVYVETRAWPMSIGGHLSGPGRRAFPTGGYTACSSRHRTRSFHPSMEVSTHRGQLQGCRVAIRENPELAFFLRQPGVDLIFEPEEPC